MTAAATIKAYYDAFNAGDMQAFLALLDDNVVHGINQGGDQVGKAAGRLDQPVGKRRLAMVDMGDDGKVADMVEGYRGAVAHARHIAAVPGLD